jgi:quinol monooxygenase YgiN
MTEAFKLEGRTTMSEENVVLFARLKVKPEMVEKAKSAALAIVAESRSEAGCLNYDVHQAIDDETLFFWHETWANKAAIDAHFKTPFFEEFAKGVEEFAAEPPQINLSHMITEKA